MRAWRRVVLFAVGCALAIVVAHALDRTAMTALYSEKLDSRDWGRLLRIIGYFPAWILLASIFIAIDWRQALRIGNGHRWLRGVMVTLGAGTAGLVAEGVKLVTRRMRPEAATEQQLYVFRCFSEETWSTAGLGMASSHAAVAFGGCWMLARLHPEARWLFVALAIGCALSRVMIGAHYLSDVIAGAAVGVGCAWAWWEVHLRMERRGRVAVETP